MNVARKIAVAVTALVLAGCIPGLLLFGAGCHKAPPVTADVKYTVTVTGMVPSLIHVAYLDSVDCWRYGDWDGLVETPWFYRFGVSAPFGKHGIKTLKVAASKYYLDTIDFVIASIYVNGELIKAESTSKASERGGCGVDVLVYWP